MTISSIVLATTLATAVQVADAPSRSAPPPPQAGEAVQQSPAQISPAATRETPTTSARDSQRLRIAVSKALRHEATTDGPQHAAALRRLVATYEEVNANTTWPDAERRKRLGQIRSRLSRAADQLEEQVVPATKKRVAVVRTAQVLAQRQQNQAPANRQRPAGPAGQRAPIGAGLPAGTVPGEAEQAEQLIELIRNTIAPDSWDVRGGPGTMFYFAPKKVLVIRQTGAAHDKFGDLFRQLRRN